MDKDNKKEKNQIKRKTDKTKETRKRKKRQRQLLSIASPGRKLEAILGLLSSTLCEAKTACHMQTRISLECRGRVTGAAIEHSGTSNNTGKTFLKLSFYPCL